MKAQQADLAYSWNTLVEKWRASPRYQKLSPSSRRGYNAVLDGFLPVNGDLDVRDATFEAMEAIHLAAAEFPRKADYRIQTLKMLLNIAKKKYRWIDSNPAGGVELFGKQTEWEPWFTAQQELSVSRCRALMESDDRSERFRGRTVLTAFYLGVGTGQRASDLLGMKWTHVEGDAIYVRQDKTDVRLRVACPQFLIEYLATAPREGKFILARDLHNAITYDRLAKLFRSVRDEAGLPKNYVMHGWR